VESPELVVASIREWQAWLRTHHSDSDGVWLVLAKRGTTHPTTLSYDEALEEAICFGWIDAATFRRRFTPRKARSPWSQRNVAIVEKLTAAGRMQPPGDDEVCKAKGDGRWEAAYAGRAAIEVPEDLAEALKHNPQARAVFEQLTSSNRYSVLYRIASAKRAETRARRIEQFVDMLATGSTLR
jgi:uncharacterized protein YdeI (YjbR/CyaY-like superfamily)